MLSIILGLGATAADKTDKFLHLWKRAFILSWGMPKIEINRCFLKIGYNKYLAENENRVALDLMV